MSEMQTDALAAAIAGDRLALGRLLMQHDARLRRKIAKWIPTKFTALMTVDDILQETYTEAYRHIASFKPGGDESFYGWIAKIAERRFLNARRWLLAAKRGAGRQVDAPTPQSGSFVELVRVLAGGDSTPSGKAARAENERLTQVALAGLKDDYREALWMRYIEGRPVREIAETLGRTERAVHMLCNRGLHALREGMGHASKYFSDRS